MYPINDKDKLLVVANIYVSGLSKDKAANMLFSTYEKFSTFFDNSIKFIVMPVLVPELQKIEVLNPKFADDETLQKIWDSYESFTKILEEKSN